MKLIISIICWLMILVPFTFLFVLFGVISLEMGFGVSPPVCLATVCFLLAMLFSIFWRIGSGNMKILQSLKYKPPKRLLRVRFIREGEQF